MAHSDKHRPKKNVTVAMTNELEQTPFVTSAGQSNLLRGVDNAAQTAFVPILPTHEAARTALKDLSKVGGQELSDEQITQAMSRMFDIHNGMLAPQRHNVKHSVPSEDFHRFYSLVYHIVAEDDRMKGREAISKAFETLKLDPPLAREEVARYLDGILALADKRSRGKA